MYEAKTTCVRKQAQYWHEAVSDLLIIRRAVLVMGNLKMGRNPEFRHLLAFGNIASISEELIQGLPIKWIFP